MALVVMKVADAKDEELDQVPIKYVTIREVAPFESVTRMYALPKYNEVDPTPYLKTISISSSGWW